MARTDPQINVRIPSELREHLDIATKETGRSLTGEIVARLEKTFAPQVELEHAREVLAIQKRLSDAQDRTFVLLTRQKKAMASLMQMMIEECKSTGTLSAGLLARASEFVEIIGTYPGGLEAYAKLSETPETNGDSSADS